MFEISQERTLNMVATAPKPHPHQAQQALEDFEVKLKDALADPEIKAAFYQDLPLVVTGQGTSRATIDESDIEPVKMPTLTGWLIAIACWAIIGGAWWIVWGGGN